MSLLVINHHYVRPEKYQAGIYPVTPEELEHNIKRLFAEGWRPVSLEDLLDDPKRCFGAKSFLITFDDGLRCSFQYGIPVIERLGIRAVFFISTAVLEGTTLFVHKLHFIRSQVPDDQLLQLVREIIGSNIDFDLDRVRVQYRYDNLLAAKVKYLFNFELISADRDRLADQILTDYLGVSLEEFHSRWYMGKNEIQALKTGGHAIGSHGHFHLPLARLKPKQILDEIRRSRDMLTCHVGHVPKAISYPYGGPESVSLKVLEIVRNLGFKIGFTMRRGVNSYEDWVQNTVSLKRIDVKDLDDWAFEKESS